MKDLHWEDERYVRLYTRDTTSWLMLGWEAHVIYPMLLRLVDRAGVLPLGGHGADGVRAHTKIPTYVISAGIKELTDDGWIEIVGEKLIICDFIESQEARQSDKARQRKSRDMRRNPRDESSQNVTDGHKTSHPVTGGHEVSLLAVPSLAVPKEKRVSPKQPAPRPPPAAALEIANHLLAAIRSHKPDFDPKASVTAWAKQIPDKHLGKAGRLKAAADFAHRTEQGAFWRPNVLSCKKLLEKLDVLEIQATEHRKNGGTTHDQDIAELRAGVARTKRELERLNTPDPDPYHVGRS